MSTNTRQWSQRQLQFAIGNINEAGDKLQRIKEIYYPNHQDIGNGLQSIQEVLIEVIREIEVIKRSF
jgi:hypothetical protein